MSAGDYVGHPENNDLVGFNIVAVTSMVNIHGPNVAMAKLIFMHATHKFGIVRLSVGRVLGQTSQLMFANPWWYVECWYFQLVRPALGND